MRSSGTGLPSGRLFNAPYFDATDPEDRNNEQLAGSVSYFLTTSKTGSHDVKAGVGALQLERHGRQLADLNRIRLLDAVPDRRERRAGVRQQRPRGAGVRSQRDARL